ncbi:bifunctional phosphoribosylaminoimidazolecarboxamide formyltransferase/IMP cyclohydrolase [Alicyclobacillus sp. SO9]|uniref:bifunctional phosphoribosylaminoimidazolecarboxamide formyltransferase/IMP cyclohydrolase n=1 Tax=Alicyclobacillus sp. SO9 TaxID=2665646 RepID=UPI0018E73D8C|nr:bifunctional phosphoribosylaminoimidazolecarboxamide formyltransferase/IMP cyclohydrolase [Alicyclobacillus sp. SO9]QQE78565.1 bifunctional phosphoribosylaminoimidazolecarboxamide formyltransferase/IMP cyclohydrolase [Alicyclobacillus sp. SO9]
MRKWALVSVFDKQGVAEFCKQLAAAGYGILSTGGTARHLQENGIDVTQVEDYTGFPEMMDGRVKTLHPKIHGGLLGLRDNEQHVESMEEHGIDSIDLVVVNLYPFAKTIENPQTTFAEAIEMIDIGGPSMLRSAAKNHRFCLPVLDPADYEWIASRLASGEAVSASERMRLAAKVFAETSQYDGLISSYLTQAADKADKAVSDNNAAVSATADAAIDGASQVNSSEIVTPAWPSLYTVSFVHKQALRYGENPHQQAHFYAEPAAKPSTIAGAVQLQGKELSYNNIQDADAALNILRSLDDMAQPAAVAVKHMNPCGVGLGEDIEQAFERAFEADSVSIFGGIIALNRPVTKALAERLTGMFLEIIIAPSYTDEARQLFQTKKNLRLLTVDMATPAWQSGDTVLRRVSGGLLVQSVDSLQPSEWTTATDRAPSEAELKALRFAWRLVRFVKSNAILLANSSMTVGVGAGQMNRVGAAKIAIEQAGSKAKGSVMASDAFFPMPDTVETAAAAGITAIVQPGGSKRDQDSIDAANKHNIAMVLTGTRHFLH